MTVLLFEDEAINGLLPLVYARPVFDLRCGAWTLRERVTAFLSSVRGRASGTTSVPAALCRPHLMRCFGPSKGLADLLGYSEPLILLNGRSLDLDWLPELLAAPINTAFTSNGVLVGARLSPALASAMVYYLRQQASTDALIELRRFATMREIRATLLSYPWEMIAINGEQIVRDAPLLAVSRDMLPFTQVADQYPHVVVHKAEQVYVAPGTRLDGPLVLDARDGPILLDGVQVEPFSFIQGPTYLGSNALIASARIRGETSIGPVCRIGGEVEASIVQGYSNKHHDGFLGHSFLGEWVNIGAMTTNSDLKNTYGNVRVTLDGQGQFDTKQLKLGCFLGDHVKLGIGLHLTGGTVIGIGSNIFGVHTAPKTVAPFTWGGEVFREYRIDSMVEVTRKVMSRRKLSMDATYETMLRDVFAMTRASRSAFDQILRTEEHATLLAHAEGEAVRAFELSVGESARLQR